ncbi:MAG: RagB/SusD family nutrient uptake outer membrane protein, partial [Bacteroidota bacterium]
EPLGRQSELTFFDTPDNAILAINGVYDVVSWDENNIPADYVGHNYEFFFGDILSDDAEKGSSPSDFQVLTEMKEWRSTPGSVPTVALWNNLFIGVYRANLIIANIDDSPLEENLKNRVKGEAQFLRGYFYFYLLRVFGGLPLFAEPVIPSQYGAISRATLAETYLFIENDFQAAIELLPEKNAYPAADLGRATKGAARAYLARAIMDQLGTDNSNGHSWQEVFDLSDAIINSGQYSLTPNYAEIFEQEGENNQESIFEVQALESTVDFGPGKVGTTNFIFQNNRTEWGWGFNNPTQDLVNSFEANDPRLAITVYGDGDVVLGKIQEVPFPSENMTGFLNRKAAGLAPVAGKASGQNIRKMRYADVLLMKAEAAANLGNEVEARRLLNQIRLRARQSTLPKGSVEGDAATYEPTNIPNDALPDITASGQALMEAI